MKILLFIFALINYSLFGWSVVAVFKGGLKQKTFDYKLLQFGSLVTWVTNLYCIWVTEMNSYSNVAVLVAIAIQILSGVIFWHCKYVNSKQKLSLAFSTDLPIHIQKSGFYKYFPHPFYASYLLSYLSASIFSMNIFSIGCFILMGVIYYRAASMESEKMKLSFLSDEYKKYRKSILKGQVEKIESVIYFLIPEILVQTTPWVKLWKDQYKSQSIKIWKISCLVVAIAYVLHYYLVDMKLGLTPIELWRNYRFSMAAMLIFCFLVYFSKQFNDLPFYKLPMIIATAVLCYFEAKSILWYDQVGYLYSFVFVVVCVWVLRLSLIGSLVYGSVVMWLQLPIIFQSGVPFAVGLSAFIMTIAVIIFIRSGLILEIKSFIATQDLLESRKREIETKIIYTNELQLKTDALQKNLDELKKTRAELIQSEKMASVGRLVAGVSHELNNPLNFLMPIVSDLDKDMSALIQVREKYRDFRGSKDQNLLVEIDAIETAAKLEKHLEQKTYVFQTMKSLLHRISLISQKLKIFSRKSSEVRYSQVDVHKVITETIDLIPTNMKEKVKFTYDFCSEFAIKGNEVEISQVVLNIVQNAMDAMGGVGEISVVTKDEEKNHRLTIADSGPGISEGNLNKIFDPFFTTKDPGKGTGLGLSICHQIVENHGATISCTSQIGKGAQFHILFPKSNMEVKEGVG